MSEFDEVLNQLRSDNDFWFNFYFNLAIYLGSIYNKLLLHIQIALEIYPNADGAIRLKA